MRGSITPARRSTRARISSWDHPGAGCRSLCCRPRIESLFIFGADSTIGPNRQSLPRTRYFLLRRLHLQRLRGTPAFLLRSPGRGGDMSALPDIRLDGVTYGIALLEAPW